MEKSNKMEEQEGNKLEEEKETNEIKKGNMDKIEKEQEEIIKILVIRMSHKRRHDEE